MKRRPCPGQVAQLSIIPMHQKVAGSIPGQGAYRRQQINVFLSLSLCLSISPSLRFSLSIIKKHIKLGFKKIESRPRAELMLMINICRVIATASMLPPLLEASYHAIFKLPKQRPGMEGLDPRAGLQLSVCHLQAE